MSFDVINKVNSFETAVEKIAQLSGPAGPSVGTADLDQLFAPVLSLFAPGKRVVPSPEAAANALQNLGQQLDAALANSSNPANLEHVKAKVNQLVNSQLFQANPANQNALASSSKTIKGMLGGTTTPAAAPAPSRSDVPRVDVKAQQKELETASSVVKGIAQMMSRPGANRKVLLARLNKYRLIPMAKLFNQLSSNQNLDSKTKSFLVNLAGLFKQVKDTFTGEDLEALLTDQDVKSAIDKESNVGASDAPIANVALKALHDELVKCASNNYKPSSKLEMALHKALASIE